MSKRVMTEERQKRAREFYESSGLSLNAIAEEIEVNPKSFGTWIRSQDWYVKGYRNKADKIQQEFKRGTMDPQKANPAKQIGKFVIPWRLPGLNEFIASMNRTRYQGNEMKRKTEKDIALCAEIGLDYDKPYSCAVHLNIHFVESNHRRDYDNIMTGQKFILDALQQAGVIEDDDQAHVLPSQFSFSFDPDYPRVEVEIVPHPEKPIPRKPSVRRESKPKPKEDANRFVIADGKRIRLQMDKGEILRSYEAAADKKQQITILADLNAVAPKVIRQIIAGA